MLLSVELSIFDTIQSVLGTFHVLVTTYYVPLPAILSKGDIQNILRTETPYHLVHVLYTESNPGGGWWFGDGQSDEALMLEGLLTPYDQIARKASSARLFTIACGLNLAGSKVISNIKRALNRYVPWPS
ncbi:hypothetical protein FRC06_005546 [Ceratobasidium sp. 370]|nr:hypothetical protein FRC06_005546 [Ceratobasidium sp. 370]